MSAGGGDGLRQWRCSRCNALLALAIITRGSIVEIKCWRCRAVNQIEGDEQVAA